MMMMMMTMMIYYIRDDPTVDRGRFLVSIKTYLPPQYDLTASDSVFGSTHVCAEGFPK